MDYEILTDVGEFAATHSGWFIAGEIGIALGAGLGAGYASAKLLDRIRPFLDGAAEYVYDQIYDRTRPVVEGRVFESNLTKDGSSSFKIRTEKQGDLELLFSLPIELAVMERYSAAYVGQANNLQAALPIGSKLKPK